MDGAARLNNGILLDVWMARRAGVCSKSNQRHRDIMAALDKVHKHLLSQEATLQRHLETARVMMGKLLGTLPTMPDLAAAAH